MTEPEPEPINFLDDDPKDMTHGRRLALRLMKHKWYYPRLGEIEGENNDRSAPGEEEYEEGVDKARGGIRPKLTFAEEAIRKGSFRSVWGHPVERTVKEKPSLEAAWAFFEHVSLPRYLFEREKGGTGKSKVQRVINKFRKGNKQLEKAEPGEMFLKTKLYDAWFTPHSQLGDFGLGVGLYFTSLRGVMILAFLAGVMNFPSLVYYSRAYNNGASDAENILLKGAAICDSTSWVPCSDCYPSDSFYGDRFRWLNESTKQECFPGWCDEAATNGTNIDLGTGGGGFARKTNCEGATLELGLINLFTLVFMGLGMGVVAAGSKRIEVYFDEDEQTAQDYSIIIQEPPGDARDPEEWKRFFETNFEGAHVTCCTIAIDNDDIVRQLFTRRECMKRLEMLVQPGTSMDMVNMAKVSAITARNRSTLQKWMAMFSPGIPEYYAKVAAITATIRGWVQLTYPVTNVFITFETEEAQRRVLSAMSVGRMHVRSNNKSVVQPQYLFRGQYVLAVEEAEEPDSIRWQDLNEPLLSRMKQQTVTSCITLAAVYVVALIVQIINDSIGPTYAAYFISVMNTLFPMAAKTITDMEAHGSEGARQTSLYWKIALFRWINTAVVFTIITPFNDTISSFNSVLIRVQSIFVSEIVTSTLLQVFDLGGHFARHFSAPRAKTQDAMNMNMRGSQVQLAERYTNVTKILFLALWYSSIYPLGLFLCALALFINYYVDKFSLTRTWARAPMLGADIALFSRKYFFPLALTAMSVMSSFFFSGFPYDNLCEKGRVGNSNYTQFIGNWEVPPRSSEEMKYLPFTPETESIRVAPSDFIYEHCFQNLLEAQKFPFTSKQQKENNIWMSPDQELVTDVHGYASIVVISIVLLAFAMMIIQNIRSAWTSGYTPRGDDQKINFSDVEVMAAYVPQVQSTVYPYPLLVTRTTEFDPDLMDWTDPDRHCSFYDLTKDADILVKGTYVKHREVFSQIYHWPPSQVDKKTKENDKVE